MTKKVKDIMTEVLYKHTNGIWHKKLVHTKDDLNEIKESTFTDEVVILTVQDEAVISDRDKNRIRSEIEQVNSVRIYPVVGINPRTNKLSKIINLEKLSNLTKKQVGAANAYLRKTTYGFRIAVMGHADKFETWYYPDLWETGKEQAVLDRRHPFRGKYR